MTAGAEVSVAGGSSGGASTAGAVSFGRSSTAGAGVSVAGVSSGGAS